MDSLWLTNMAMENEPFEDVFPIEYGEFSIISMLVYWSVDILNSIIPPKKMRATNIFSMGMSP